MCDPATLLALTAAGGSLASGFLGSQSHKQSAELARGNVDLLNKEGQIATGKADLATIRGNYDEFLTRRNVGRTLASETAQTVASGADPTWGSPLVVQAFSAAQGETDAQLIRARAEADRADALTTAANIYGGAATQAYKALSEDTASTVSLINGVTGAGTAFLTASKKWPGLSGAPSSGSGYSMDANGNPFLVNR